MKDAKGIFGEIVTEIEKRLGSEHRPEQLPWTRAQVMTKSSDNVLIYPVTRTPQRENQFTWMIPVMRSEMVFVTYDRDPIDETKARDLKTIFAHHNAPPYSILEGKGFTNLYQMYYGVGSVLRMLETGRGDAWFTAKDLALFTIKDSEDKNKFSFGPPVVEGVLYIAASKKINPTLVKKYQYFFAELKADGSYDKICKKYLGN